MNLDSTPNPRMVRVLASYLMDDPQVSENYANELTTLATKLGQALTRVADDVQLVYVDALRPGRGAAEMLQYADAVVLLGGTDVDPRRFTSDEQAISKSVNVSPAADEFEIELALGATQRGIPVLGICRGLQIMNVAFGGSLITDLGPGTMHSSDTVDESVPHNVTITEGTRLRDIYPAAEIEIRSAHHQAISKIGPGLKAAAMAADGIVEAIETTDDSWLVGVQWHPEDSQGNPEHFELLAQAFIAEARAAAARKSRG